jgi:2-oxoglutarate ferredoxin oxidoreductase subunit gamma
MIVLGAYLKLKPIVELENVMKGLKKSIPERHHNLLPLNEQAILRGKDIVNQVQKA